MEEILQQINSVAFQMSSNPSLTYGDLDVRTKDAVSVLPDPRADLDARFFGSAYSHFHQFCFFFFVFVFFCFLFFVSFIFVFCFYFF